MKIPCICINNKNKPTIIPDSLWLKEKQQYHIIWIYKMINQDGGIQGCDISEKDISAYVPFNCFKLERFAFKQEDLDKLKQLIKDCTELNDIKIDELIEQLETTI